MFSLQIGYTKFGINVASSVNLYRFTHFLELPFGSFFANLLVGVTPNPPEHHLPMMATQQSC